MLRIAPRVVAKWTLGTIDQIEPLLDKRTPLQGGKQLSWLTVEYPVSTQPYLRVTIRGWTKTAAIRRAPLPICAPQ